MKKRDLFTIFFSVVAGLVILAQVKADPCGMVPPIFYWRSIADYPDWVAENLCIS